MADRSMGISGSGWSQFAGIFLFIAGIFNAMDGLVALARKSYFDQAALVVHNITLWGWVYLVIGIVQLLAGWLVLSRSGLGRVLGLIIAVVSMAVSFFAIGAYPWWAILTIAIDAAIVYGLTARWEA